jgi:hypothetical protein
MLLWFGKALESLAWNKKIWFAFAFLLLSEHAFVRNYGFWKSLPGNPDPRLSQFIPSTTVTKTVEWGDKPDTYFETDTKSRRCYEASLSGLPVRVVASSDPQYRGEVYFAEGSGSVRLVSVTPREMTLDVDALEKGRIVLNTNPWEGWMSLRPDMTNVAPSEGGLLSLDVEPGRYTLPLMYVPKYWLVSVTAWCLGLVLWGAAALGYFAKKPV